MLLPIKHIVMTAHKKTISTRINLSTATLERPLVLILEWMLDIDAEIYSKCGESLGSEA